MSCLQITHSEMNCTVDIKSPHPSVEIAGFCDVKKESKISHVRSFYSFNVKNNNKNIYKLLTKHFACHTTPSVLGKSTSEHLAHLALTILLLQIYQIMRGSPVHSSL